MFGAKIKLDKDLYNKAKNLAEIAGYSSTEEFITHLIERELSKLEQKGDSEEDVKRRLQGLGYL
jgi:metal-responsive CopG/Arc/MetJ family transcriptional regulator